MSRAAPARVGIVGAGRWGAVHRDALAQVGAELAGVATSREASAAEAERAWGVPATHDLDTFLGWDMDAVIVVSPNHLHAEHGIAALEAGFHVLVEKPMAVTARGCADLLAAAERSGRVLAVGHEMRVFSLFAKVKEILDAGVLGAPVHCDLRLLRRPHRAGSGGWKSDPAKLGSSILEEPIHYFDLARWYLGEPVRLQAWATSRAGREALWENLDVRMVFAGGAQAMVTRSIAGWGHHVSLDIVGEAGALRARWDGARDVDRQPRVSLVVAEGGDGRGGAGRDADPAGAPGDDPDVRAGARVVEVPQETGHAFDVPAQTRAFLAAIRGEGAVPADARDGCAAVELCLAVERSLVEGSVPIDLT